MHEHDSSILPIHHYTGCQAVGIVNGRPVWPIRGGSEPPPPADPPPSPPGPGPAYTPPASQAELDRIIETRLARDRARFADYDTLKAKAEKHDALELELSSDKDKAVKEARDEERAKAKADAAPRIAQAEFKAEAKGVLTADQLSALLEDLDLTKYVTGDGEPDTEKIAAKIAKFAPVKGQNGAPPRPLGQGHQQAAAPSARDLGRAEAEKRFGKKQ